MVDKLDAKDFIKSIGDPFKILQIEETNDKKAIKQAYKVLARILHPDKNIDSSSGIEIFFKNNIYFQEQFIKVKQAYDFLLDKKKIEDYFRLKTANLQRSFEMQQASREQQQFAADLLRREQEFDRKREELETLKKMKIQEELNKLAKQKLDEENKQKEKERKKIQFELENKDHYKKLNSIKVKWSKDKTFNQQLLRIIFKQYGPLKEIKLIEGKPKAHIEFHTTEAANKAIQDSNNDLKIKPWMKPEKRDQLQKFLKQSQANIERDESQVFILSTDTLKRISHFSNKDSKVIVTSQVDLLRREEERKKMMQKILDEELENL